MASRIVLLSALCSILVTALGIELAGTFWDVSAVDAPPASALTPPRITLPAPSASRAESWTQVLLARPLFARDRRPVSVPRAAGAAVPSAVPRLSGVVIDGGTRRAIFAGVSGDKPVTAAEGDDVSGFKIQAIDIGQVILFGQGGRHVLRPTFDLRPPPLATNPAAFSSVPSVQNLRSLSPMPNAALPNPGPASGVSAR